MVCSASPGAEPEQARQIEMSMQRCLKFGGVSLNDSLMAGADFLQSLIGIIFRFREKQIALTADVEAMFIQVKSHPADCKVPGFCGEKAARNLFLCMNMEDTFLELRVRQNVSTMLCNKSEETADMKTGWSQN